MRIAGIQADPLVGDVDGNLGAVIKVLSEVPAGSYDLLVFPEMFLTGYPPRDLLERASFVDRVQQAVAKLIAASRGHPGLGILVGAPVRTGLPGGRGLHNSALLICDGELVGVCHKMLLPTYDVFDETRYFDPGLTPCLLRFKDELLGVTICEDAWNDPELWVRRHYDHDPVAMLAGKGATVMVNIAASPFVIGKDDLRYRVIASHVRKWNRPFVFLNQVGGMDELVFDGSSFALDEQGRMVAAAAAFSEDRLIVDTRRAGTIERTPREAIVSLHDALVLGLRDYMRKCRFDKVLMGLSGGIDSAVVACLACRAAGAGNVMGVALPGPYSTPGSVTDAQRLANNLGIGFRIIPIHDLYREYTRSLRADLEGRSMDVTEENLQARIRGTMLMALSNRYGSLVLACGNKSEMAVGYCTLYGDMIGGLALISDVPKTMVYRLAEYLNREGEVIPRSTIDKPPSAELRPNQRDQDTLPPYDVLDAVLELYVEQGKSPEEIAACGFDPRTVEWIVSAVGRSEYKRWQSAPGIKVTSKAFGIGRRMPIAARY